MAKNIKLWENTVVTTDDKGNPALVGFAKEALVSFDKMKIDVTIQLKDHDKETVEKLLKDNDVPYKQIITADEKDGKDKYDLCVVGGNVVKLGSWKWTAEEVVGKLYDKEEKQMSEQESMNKRLEDIKKFTQERNKKKNDSVHPLSY